MDVQLLCECGQKTPVAATQAGLHLPCRCGREIVVPSLGELRRMSGTGPAVSPRLTIESMVSQGELPATNDCAGCGAETRGVVDVFAICERARAESDNTSTRLVLVLLFGWVGLLISLVNRERRLIGTDREVRLPLRICPDCAARRLRPFPVWPLVLVAVFPAAAGAALGVYLELPQIAVVSIVAAVVFVFGGLVVLRARFAGNVRRLLRYEPVYIRLLEQFPNAQFVILPRERALQGRT
jgi:hypothetical protein